MNGETVVVDSSAVVAIFKRESDSAHFAERIASYKRRVMSAATRLESAMICENVLHPGGGTKLQEIIEAFEIEIPPLTSEQARLAVAAFKRFGKGRGTKASLNFGDCFVYALAKELEAPLLFEGTDFVHTDLAEA